MLKRSALSLATKVVAIGESYTVTRRFTADDVAMFIKLTHDDNPVHSNPEAAKAAGFPGCLVHGMLVASLFSHIMGNYLPGPGSIYMQQNINFRAPVFVDDEVEATIKVSDFDTTKGNIILDTVVTKNGKVVINGRAIGRNRIVRFRRGEEETPSVDERAQNAKL